MTAKKDDTTDDTGADTPEAPEGSWEAHLDKIAATDLRDAAVLAPLYAVAESLPRPLAVLLAGDLDEVASRIRNGVMDAADLRGLREWGTAVVNA